MVSSAFLDCYGALDVLKYVKERGAKSLHRLKRNKRVKSLISYYQLLQYRVSFEEKLVNCKLTKGGGFKPLENNKKLRKFVENAWDGKVQVLHLLLDPYQFVDAHAVMVLPFVKDKLAKSGYYELKAYDPDEPDKMLKIRVCANGELQIPTYFGHLRNNPIYKIQYAASDAPWKNANINGK